MPHPEIIVPFSASIFNLTFIFISSESRLRFKQWVLRTQMLVSYDYIECITKQLRNTMPVIKISDVDGREVLNFYRGDIL